MNKFAFLVFIVLTLAACQNSLLSDLDGFYDTAITAKDIRPPEIDENSHATGNLSLKTQYGNKRISWITSSHSGINESGELLQPGFDSTPIENEISAVVTFSNGMKKTFAFNVIVDPLPIDDGFAVSEANDVLSIVYSPGDTPAAITAVLGLPTSGLHGTAVSWNTSSVSAISPDGSVIRPSFSSGDSPGTIVATISRGSASATKTFTVNVLRLPQTDTDRAQEDADALNINFASGDSASSVTEDIGLPSAGSVYSSAISWNTGGHSAVNSSGIISTASGDWWSAPINTVSGTVVATVTKGSASVTKSFNLDIEVSVPIPVPSGFNNYTQFGDRNISFPKITGADVIVNYQIQYRSYSGGSWSSWAGISAPTASTGSSPVVFGWAPSQLATGHYQFRFRVNRNGRSGDWGVTPEYPSF